MPIVGIDLGTTNSSVAVWRNGKAELIPNALGEVLTPSAVGFDAADCLTVGAVARERLISHPERTAASFKRWMGTHKKLELAGKEFTPQELSALVLDRLRRDAEAYLGEPVTEAVISVPAYFNDNQRAATKQAASLAGLCTERIINEPSAAALAYRLQHGEEDSCLLIFDFGGGTLDVSIVECFENVIEIVAIAGDNRLGGNDVDHAIVERFCEENGLAPESVSPEMMAALVRQAEQCKRALAENETAEMRIEYQGAVFKLMLTRSLLQKLCEEMFARMKKVLARAVKDSGKMPDEIDDVVLVGGSSKLVLIPDFLTALFGKPPVRLADPDTVVARGVGVYAGIKERSGELQDIVMTDVCPFTLGTQVVNNQNDQNPHTYVMIERNSVLPVSRTQRFHSISANQKQIAIRILQGEEYYAKDNLELGNLHLPIPPGPAGSQSVAATFTYDINGVLQVDVEHTASARKVTAYVVNPSLQLSDQELERKLSELAQIKRRDAMQSEEDQLLLATAERLFTESTGRAREEASGLIAAYGRILENASLARRRQGRVWMKRQIEILTAHQSRLDSIFELEEWGNEE